MLAQTFTANLRRTEEGLGFSIAGGVGSTPFRNGDSGIFVSKVNEDGQADKIGKIQVGDKILSVSFPCKAVVTGHIPGNYLILKEF